MQPGRYIDIVHAPIDLRELHAHIEHPDAGSIGWFCGVTRRTTASDAGEKITESLSYEAHEPMARRELQKLADLALEKFSLHRVVLVHRLGEVPLGESSVVVGCSSSHRGATFQALAWIMDTLKQRIPIWKREMFVDGSTEWVHPTNDESDGVSAGIPNPREQSDG